MKRKKEEKISNINNNENHCKALEIIAKTKRFITFNPQSLKNVN